MEHHTWSPTQAATNAREHLIVILDEIHCSAQAIPDLMQRFEQDYLPGALNRGLTLTAQWVSPPVALPDQGNTLWWQWQVAGGRCAGLLHHACRADCSGDGVLGDSRRTGTASSTPCHASRRSPSPATPAPCFQPAVAG